MKPNQQQKAWEILDATIWPEGVTAGSLPSPMKTEREIMWDFCEWYQGELDKHEHCCVTGDCPHSHIADCWGKLIDDCLADLAAANKSPNDRA